MDQPQTDEKAWRRISVRENMAAKAKQGYLVGPVKLGYVAMWTRDGVLPVADPRTAPLIARAFVEVAANGLSLRQVTRVMQAEGLKGRRGEPISLPTMQRVLTDPYYAGFGEASGNAKDNRHASIVPQALFEAVQGKLRARRAFGR